MRESQTGSLETSENWQSSPSASNLQPWWQVHVATVLHRPRLPFGLHQAAQDGHAGQH